MRIGFTVWPKPCLGFFSLSPVFPVCTFVIFCQFVLGTYGVWVKCCFCNEQKAGTFGLRFKCGFCNGQRAGYFWAFGLNVGFLMDREHVLLGFRFKCGFCNGQTDRLRMHSVPVLQWRNHTAQWYTACPAQVRYHSHPVSLWQLPPVSPDWDCLRNTHIAHTLLHISFTAC